MYGLHADFAYVHNTHVISVAIFIVFFVAFRNPIGDANNELALFQYIESMRTINSPC